MFGSTTFPPSSSALGITATPIKPPEDPGFLRFLYGLGLLARGFVFKNAVILRNVSLGIFVLLAGSYGCAQFISWKDCRPKTKCRIVCSSQLPEGTTIDGACDYVNGSDSDPGIKVGKTSIYGDVCTLTDIEVEPTDPTCFEDEPGEGEGEGEDPGEGEGEEDDGAMAFGQPEVAPVVVHMHDPRPPFAARVFMSDRCFYNGL